MDPMKITGDLLSMLRCPSSGQPLQIANSELIAALNQSIKNGSARDRLEQKVTEPIEDGLVTSEGDWLYPVRSGIPTLVTEEAIQINLE